MNLKVRQGLSDLLNLSGNTVGYEWLVLCIEGVKNPIVYPAAFTESLLPFTDQIVDQVTHHLSQKETGLTPIGKPLAASEQNRGGIEPRLCAAVGLYDSSGRYQGALVGLDRSCREPIQAQHDGMMKLARLAEQQIELVALGALKRRLKTQDNQVALLSEVARQTSNGVVITDQRGLITWVNRGFQTITGYSIDEALGRKPGSFLQGEGTDPDTVAYIGARLSERRGFDADLVNYYRDGRPYWVRIHCEPLLNGDGGLRGFIAIQTDIDAEKLNQERLEQSLSLNRAILGTLHDAVITTDIKGIIRTVNPALEKMFGYPASALLGQPITCLMPPEIAGHHSGYMNAYAEDDQPSDIMGNLRSIQGVRSDGTRFPLRIAVTEATVNSERLLVAALHDISASEEAKADLQRFKQTLDSTLDCVFMFDAETLRFFYVNQGSMDQLGYSRQELLSMRAYDIKPLYSAEAFKRMVAPLVSGNIPHLSFQTMHQHKKGHQIPVDVFLQYVELEGNPPRFVAIVRDFTERMQQQNAIEKLAYYDPLTNLPNRRLIREKLDSAMADCAASGRHGAILLTDLDDFKTVNDTLGHRRGDDLLVEISARFRDSLSESDSLSRLGGDEFLAVLTNLPGDPEDASEQALAIARRMLEAATLPTDTLAGTSPVSTSLGAVLFHDTSVPASELIRMADIAMYDAKKKGKNCVSVFDDVMQQKVLEEHNLTGDLALALTRNDEILPWYQPKVDEQGLFTGFEALVRWQHPHRGLLNPGQFIPLAESKNLIIALGDLVLLQACRQMAAWRRALPIDHWTISVNVSQSQLAMPGFPKKVEDVLRETGLPPQVLQLEITETTVAENIRESIEQMEQIRALGVTFSLDDFGTGYSSLSYLRQLPIDELKIDRSFVESLLHDEEGVSIVRSILLLAGSLGLSVVAEGIEEAEQWQILKDLGCKGYQGYLFSRPQPAEAVPELIRRCLA